MIVVVTQAAGEHAADATTAGATRARPHAGKGPSYLPVDLGPHGGDRRTS